MQSHLCASGTGAAAAGSGSGCAGAAVSAAAGDAALVRSVEGAPGQRRTQPAPLLAAILGIGVAYIASEWYAALLFFIPGSHRATARHADGAACRQVGAAHFGFPGRSCYTGRSMTWNVSASCLHSIECHLSWTSTCAASPAGAAAAGGAPGALVLQRGVPRAGAPQHRAAALAGQGAARRALPHPGGRWSVVCAAAVAPCQSQGQQAVCCSSAEGRVLGEFKPP